MRTMEGDLALEAGVRGVLGEALHLVPAEASLQEAAQAVCDGLCSLPGIDFASVDVFVDPEDAVVIALHGPESFPHGAGDHHSAALSRRLFQAGGGPWGEYWSSRPEDEEMGSELDRAGLKAFAYAPIVHGDHVDGGVGIGTTDPAFARILVERVPHLVDFNSAPTALLAERLHGYRVDAGMRTAIREVIERQTFHPVFQPIVELASGEVVGYEALTRFDGGQPPELAFADARAAGMGTELELATLGSALAASHKLPAGPWLAVNVSPALVAQPDTLRRCIANANRLVVLEVTEHEQITDYPTLRDAVRALGAEVRLAVDDAGAGIANFAHIIELDADLVKLDISLVRGVNSNPARQALVLAMRHFAQTAGCRLAAEGIETEAEAQTLAKFGVEFGQGHWFGHPEPAPTGVGDTD
ncbi:MAG: EAL domain-containing protein, partial [Candidatus Dormibacteraeota bacterium]|nr:EAL domain-containing protein [Candidatus Dormibacteraeota bacterium]